MRVIKVLLFILSVLLMAWLWVLNWVPVTIKLWAPYELVIRLPLLVTLAVLLGWLPGAFLHSFERWRLTRKLTRTEAELEARRTAAEPAVPVAPAGADDIAPPQAQPIVAPPAGA